MKNIINKVEKPISFGKEMSSILKSEKIKLIKFEKEFPEYYKFNNKTINSLIKNIDELSEKLSTQKLDYKDFVKNNANIPDDRIEVVFNLKVDLFKKYLQNLQDDINTKKFIFEITDYNNFNDYLTQHDNNVDLKSETKDFFDNLKEKYDWKRLKNWVFIRKKKLVEWMEKLTNGEFEKYRKNVVVWITNWDITKYEYIQASNFDKYLENK